MTGAEEMLPRIGVRTVTPTGPAATAVSCAGIPVCRDQFGDGAGRQILDRGCGTANQLTDSDGRATVIGTTPAQIGTVAIPGLDGRAHTPDVRSVAAGRCRFPSWQ